MLLSVERPNCGSPCLAMTRGHAAALYGLVQAVLPASVWNMANGSLRFPRNLGEPCSLLGEFPAGDTGLPTPGLGGALVRRGANTTSGTEVPPNEETKCGGMGGRKSQHPRSTDEAGELVPRDPVEERKNRKGVPGVGPWAGKYVRGFVLGITYQRHDPGSQSGHAAMLRGDHHQMNRMP